DELERVAHSDGLGVVVRRRRRHPGERARGGAENPERARILRNRGARAKKRQRRESAEEDGYPNERIRAAHVAMLIERQILAIHGLRKAVCATDLKRARTRRADRGATQRMGCPVPSKTAAAAVGSVLSAAYGAASAEAVAAASAEATRRQRHVIPIP